MRTDDFTLQILQDYAEKYTEAPSALLTQIHQDTYRNVPLPNMLAGHLQGRVLATFSHMLRPSQILEVGTYTGYSALCLAEGLQEGGMLHTIDKNKSLEATVRSYFTQAGMAHRIKYYIGQAANIIPTIDAIFDLVFIDADKKHYRRYYDLVLDSVRPGGIIVIDNVLWGGRVLPTDTRSMDSRTQRMIDFTTYVHRDTRVASLLLPIRDGLLVARKK